MLSKCLGIGNRHQPFLVAARVEFGTGNRHVPFFRSCPRGVRNWKQACPIFSELPAWSSAWSSPRSWGDNRIEGGNPGVTTGLKESCSTGLRCRAGAAGLLCRAAGASQPLAKKACCSPPTEDWNFFPGKNPELGLGRAPMPGRRVAR